MCAFGDSYHWSLIVICHPGEVADFEDADAQKSPKAPCILHMDSIRGSHSGLKSLLQSYLWEEWKERQKDSSEDISSRFSNLRFLSLELPQQQNSYDCGLFLLHYVELFLEGVPANFNPFQLTKFSNFLTVDWFQPSEASLKRTYIQRLIYDLLDYGGSDKTFPDAGSGKEFTSNCSTSSLENGTTVGILAERCSPSKAFHGNAMSSQTGQGLELTLLPASLKSSRCTRDSGLEYRDLVESEDAVGSFYQSLEQSAPLNEFKNVMLPMEGEKETGRHCGSPAAAETGLEQLVATTSQEPNPYLSTEFRREPPWISGANVHQIVPEDTNLVLETSTCAANKSLDAAVVNDGLEGINLNFEEKIDQSRPLTDSRECLMDCLGSPPSEILDQVSKHNPDHMHCTIEDTDLVRPCPMNLLGSSVHDFDTGEEGTRTCNGVQSFSNDTESAMNELHDTKRRKIIPLEGLPANLARDLHL